MKKLLPYLAIIALLILLGFGFNKYRVDTNRLQAQISQYDNDLSITRNKLGLIQTQAASIEADKKFMQDHYESRILALTNNPKVRHIESVKEIKVVVKDTVKVEVPKTEFVDVIQKINELNPGTIATIDDRWLTMDVIYDGLFFTFPYESRDSITLIDSRKKRLFRPDETTITAISHNPNSRITGLTSLSVKNRARRLGVGPFVGFGWDGTTLKPEVVLGLGVSYQLISF